MWPKRLHTRAAAYRTLFLGEKTGLSIEEARERVLADLARFCRANKNTYTRGDSHATAFLEGRREVFLRIQTFTRLTEQRLREIAEYSEGEQRE